VEEIEQILTLTSWNKEQKSSKLIGSLQGLAAEFSVDLLQYWIN
jgi:hypothetical protein